MSTSGPAAAAPLSCPRALSSADLNRVAKLSSVSRGLMHEVRALHEILDDLCADDEVEFHQYEKSSLQQLIQRKYALLGDIDALRATMLDP